MTRQKRGSNTLEIARQRLAGLRQITPPPNFGPTLTAEGFELEIDGFGNEQDGYNGDIAALDDRQNRLALSEQRLSDWNQRILAAVKAQFGPDSSEFELVGGTRRSERKKPIRKASTPGSTQAPAA